MMQHPIPEKHPESQVVCANCRHSQKGASGITICMQTVDAVTGEGINYASTWRLQGMPESVAAEVADSLEVCGPQGRFFSVKTEVERKPKWWRGEFSGD